MREIVLVVTAVSLIAAAELSEEWNHWKQYHRKKYDSENTEIERKAIWLANKNYIDEHNSKADDLGYTLAMNMFGDLVSFFFVFQTSFHKIETLCDFSYHLLSHADG